MKLRQSNTNDKFVQRLIQTTHWSRVFITTITLGTFFAVLGGIAYAIWVSSEISQEWKEILLLVLGAFIGSYNKVIDFWFNSLERDSMLMDEATDEAEILDPCEECAKKKNTN